MEESPRPGTPDEWSFPERTAVTPHLAPSAPRDAADATIGVMTDTALPEPLAEIRDEFLELDPAERLQLLLEYADDLPAVPASIPDTAFERVAECQSPVFIALEVHDGLVRMHAKAPAEAPTTRGFASILVRALTGLPVADALGVPDDFPQGLGLSQVVSPLRIAGMSGMLRRAKRQLAVRL